MIYYKPYTIWIAYDSRGKPFATWYKGYSQSFDRWKKAVKNLNYKAKIIRYFLIQK